MYKILYNWRRGYRGDGELWDWNATKLWYPIEDLRGEEILGWGFLGKNQLASVVEWYYGKTEKLNWIGGSRRQWVLFMSDWDDQSKVWV